MEASEEHIISVITDKEISAAISSAKSYNPGLRALLSIKKNTATLENAYADLMQTEGEFDELNKNGLLIIEANTSPEAATQWNSVIQESDEAVTSINELSTSSLILL